jgi:hypothetical protein
MIDSIMRRRLVVFAFLLGLLSCSSESDPELDKSSFVKIYDHNNFNASYLPIDIKQTPDGGYLILGQQLSDTTSNPSILSESYFSKAVILKVDQFGAFVSQEIVSSDKTNPIGPLLELNSNYYFFTMNPKNLQPQLNEMDSSGVINKTTSVGGSYPAAAAVDNGSFVLLSYDHIKKQSVVSTVSQAGSVLKSKGYSIGASDAVEGPIIAHFNRTGRQFPFQVGKSLNGQYFFTGFYQYTFSLVFTDISAVNPTGVVQGQQSNGGFSAVLSLDGNRYAAALFNFNDNFLLPSVSMTPTAISSITNLAGNTLPELIPQAGVKIISTNINEKEVILFASTTRSKQIAIYGYEKSSGKFIKSRYLGFSNPFEVASIISTADGGLAVCGTTYVAGRFPRICLFKLSKTDVENSFR